MDVLEGVIVVMSMLLLTVVGEEGTLSRGMAQKGSRPHSSTYPASSWDQVVVPAGRMWSS